MSKEIWLSSQFDLAPTSSLTVRSGERIKAVIDVKVRGRRFEVRLPGEIDVQVVQGPGPAGDDAAKDRPSARPVVGMARGLRGSGVRVDHGLGVRGDVVASAGRDRQKRHGRPLVVDVEADERPLILERLEAGPRNVREVRHDHRVDLEVEVECRAARLDFPRGDRSTPNEAVAPGGLKRGDEVEVVVEVVFVGLDVVAARGGDVLVEVVGSRDEALGDRGVVLRQSQDVLQRRRRGQLEGSAERQGIDAVIDARADRNS